LNVNDVSKGFVCSEAGANAAKVCESFIA
jgi:elongation factor 1-alpha